MRGILRRYCMMVFEAAIIAGVSISLTACGGQPQENRKEETVQENQADEPAKEVPEETPEEAVEEAAEEEFRPHSVSIMGDSISTYENYIPDGYYNFFPMDGTLTDVSETWWKPLVDDLGLELYANASSSGSTCVGDSTGADSPQCGCNALRTNGLCGPDEALPDMIWVYMGTNDLLRTTPLGDNDGTRKVTEGQVGHFSDAYTLILDKLLRKYPDTRIYCFTLTQIGNWGTETPFVEYVNAAGLCAEDYNACIRQIAANKGCEVVELYDCGIEVGNLQSMAPDGVHPSPEGMRCIENAVRSALEASTAKP